MIFVYFSSYYFCKVFRDVIGNGYVRILSFWWEKFFWVILYLGIKIDLYILMVRICLWIKINFGI